MSNKPLLSSRFTLALQFANEIHKSQKRKGRGAPYISHLMAVSSYVLEYGGSEDQAIAALLHDAAEDQGGRPMLDSIELIFGKIVADIVEACTDSLAEDPDQKEEWLPRKAKYHAQLAHEPEEAKLVSCADKLHNISNTLRDVETEGVEGWKYRMAQTKNGASEKQVWYYSECLKALSTNWSNPIRDELARSVVRLCELVGTDEEISQARKMRNVCNASRGS